MCGIVGCVAEEPVAGILLDGLRRVEYRGYDSAGMATISEGVLGVRKGTGKIVDIDRRLNFAHMAGNIGMAHCLHPDTYVQLADGRIKTIADMDDEEEVVSLDTATLRVVGRRAVKTSHPAPSHLLRIRTGSTEMLCTEAHRMIVARDGVITQTLASQLLEGDLLVLPKALTFQGRSRVLDEVDSKNYVRPSSGWTAAVRSAIGSRGLSHAEAARRCDVSAPCMGHIVRGDRAMREEVAKRVAERFGVGMAGGLNPVSHSRSNYVRFPSRTTPALLQLVGYLFGGGHVRPKGIRVRGRDLGLLQRYRRLFLGLFGLEGKIAKVGRGDAHELTINGVALGWWFRSNFDFESPEFLTRLGRLPDEEVAGFIRGVFDAEGVVNTVSGQLEIRMSVEQAPRVLQAFLLRFGVHSSVSITERADVNWNASRSLSIGGHENISRFLRSISSSPGRRLRRMSVLEGETERGQAVGELVVPYSKRQLQEFALGDRANHHHQRDGSPTPGTVGRLAGPLSARDQDPDLERVLRRYGASDVYFEEVSSVSSVESGVDRVFDLEVEGTENFLANGAFTHNSRWATHGGVTDANAHPHTSCRELVAVIHNGIIENYIPLKKALAAKGHRFTSETDTEIIAHLVEDEYKRGRDPLKATLAATKRLKGQYAVVVMFQDRPDVLVGARKDAPLIVGLGTDKTFLASDVLAFIEHTDRTIFLDNQEVVLLTKDRVKIVGPNGKEVRRKPTQVAWELSDLTKSDYAHFTLKEINEQRRTVLAASVQDPRKVEEFARALRRADPLYLTASGTSYHAALLMKHRLSKEARIRADTVVAGELKEHSGFIGKKAVIVAFSQSGETADLLEAVKEARKRGAKIYSIVNAAGSTLARESDGVLLLNCGPEVGVAATKSFTAQVVVANLVVDAVLGKRRSNGFK